MHGEWTQWMRKHGRTLLVVPVVIAVGVLAFLGVSGSGSSVKVASANADSRFAVNANAVVSQYGISATVTTPVGTATASAAAGNGQATGTSHNTGSGSSIAGSNGKNGKKHSTAVTSSPTSSSTAASGTTSSASATACNAAGTAGTSSSAVTAGTVESQQTEQIFSFDDSRSGDMNLFADNRATANGISQAGATPAAIAASPAAPCGASVFGNSKVVSGGYDWNVPDEGGQFVSYSKFWPVDAWGRWGYELTCQKTTPCHDTTVAYAADPAENDQLEPVTHSAVFTIPAGQAALVHLRLNHLGGQLVTQDHGEMSGLVKVHTIPSATQSALSGQRTFTIYYVRCAVWGPPETASESLEQAFPASNIGKLYGTKGLEPSSCTAS